jgi:hypothetical protein
MKAGRERCKLLIILTTGLDLVVDQCHVLADLPPGKKENSPLTHYRKGKVVPGPAIKAHRRSRCIAPLIRNLGARGMFRNNITPRPLYPGLRSAVPTEKVTWFPAPVCTFWRKVSFQYQD